MEEGLIVANSSSSQCAVVELMDTAPAGASHVDVGVALDVREELERTGAIWPAGKPNSLTRLRRNLSPSIFRFFRPMATL